MPEYTRPVREAATRSEVKPDSPLVGAVSVKWVPGWWVCGVGKPTVSSLPLLLQQFLEDAVVVVVVVATLHLKHTMVWAQQCAA